MRSDCVSGRSASLRRSRRRGRVSSSVVVFAARRRQYNATNENRKQPRYRARACTMSSGARRRRDATGDWWRGDRGACLSDISRTPPRREVNRKREHPGGRFRFRAGNSTTAFIMICSTSDPRCLGPVFWFASCYSYNERHYDACDDN